MADERNRPGWWQSAPGVMTVFLGVRAGSLSLRGRSYPLRNAQAKVHQREVTAAAGQVCIPAGGRISVTLRSPITFGRGS